ncbi:4610_t:CDS:1, partial [Funneliformis mosseae]
SLQHEYKFNIDYNNNTISENYEEFIFLIDDDTFYSIFTNFQIKEFHNIWNKDPLHYEESEVSEEFNDKLMK